MAMAAARKTDRLTTQAKYMAQSAANQGLSGLTSGIHAATGQKDRSLLPPKKPIYADIHAQRVEEATKLFMELDITGSGTLDKYEVGGALEKLGVKQTEAQLKAQMMEVCPLLIRVGGACC
jgi:hypothetical protein